MSTAVAANQSAVDTTAPQSTNPIEKEILFISDLHLALDKPKITRRFLNFLQYRAVAAHSLYILGDLFDAWIGDDDPTPPNKRIKKLLKQLTDTGIAIYLQPGNRDFLMGEKFCRETGVQLLDDYTVIDLFGEPTLLMHGDLLCTDDIPYQQFRIRSHGEQWQQQVLSKPLIIRMMAARWYRLRSHFHKRKKAQDIMDVNQQTVIKVMQKHNVLRLIHGHTHRPAIHDLTVNTLPAQRFVLAEWTKTAASVLCWSVEGYRIEAL